MVLVPQGRHCTDRWTEAWATAPIFRATELGQMLGQSGFRSSSMYQINKIGARVLVDLRQGAGAQSASAGSALKLLDKTVWFWRRVDGLLPWRGLSLVAVGAAPEDVLILKSDARLS